MSTLFSHFFQKINHISPLDNKFTEVLKNIAVMPKMLHYYGKLPENMPKSVAIVGSRKNTKYGEEVAYKLAYELAKRGVVIVSGLAIGIDSIAHRGALDAGGVTVAVLGTEIDNIYPHKHKGLAAEIIEKGGAVMSEYPAGAEICPKWSFLERNRIISGLSDVVIVVEAAEQSGSLNTAMHALEQGKELLAVPGNITNIYSQGCNKLIKQGAQPCTGVDDVLEILFPAPAKKRKNIVQMALLGDTEEEKAVIGMLNKGVRDGEEVVARLKMPVAVFNQTITMLEIKGVVRSLGANNWCLK